MAFYTISHCFTRYLKNHRFFFLQEKKKQTNQNYEGFTYGIKPMALTVVPSFSQSQRTSTSLGIKTSFATQTNRTMKQSWKEKLSVIPSLVRAVLFLVKGRNFRWSVGGSGFSRFFSVSPSKTGELSKTNSRTAEQALSHFTVDDLLKQELLFSSTIFY